MSLISICQAIFIFDADVNLKPICMIYYCQSAAKSYNFGDPRFR